MKNSRHLVSRHGVSMIELIMVFVIIGVVVAVTAPRVARSTRAVKLDRARRTVAGDIQMASVLAARHRQPVRLVRLASGDPGYRIESRSATPTVFVRRAFGATSEYPLSSLTFSRDTTYFFPNGVASNTLTVSMASDGPSKQVTMTTAGFVRVPR